MSDGFALVEYVVPKTGFPSTTKFGTCSKAPTSSGSLFNVADNKVPGPQHYHQSPAAFASKATGGGFSKLGREKGGGMDVKASSGSYEVNRNQTTPNSISFSMSKKDRGCAHIDFAINQAKWTPSPGKYDGEKPEPHMKSPRFDQQHTDSRNAGKKGAPVLGPGYYDPNTAQTLKSTPKHPWSKSATTSFLEMHTKEKDKIPAPGHHGIPESKVEDRKGRKVHVTRLLGDRIISPNTPRLALGNV
jgi:hypothetical protein